MLLNIVFVSHDYNIKKGTMVIVYNFSFAHLSVTLPPDILPRNQRFGVASQKDRNKDK